MSIYMSSTLTLETKCTSENEKWKVQVKNEKAQVKMSLKWMNCQVYSFPTMYQDLMMPIHEIERVGK